MHRSSKGLSGVTPIHQHVLHLTEAVPALVKHRQSPGPAGVAKERIFESTFELPSPKRRPGHKPKNAKKPPVQKPPRKPKVKKPSKKAAPKERTSKRRPEPTPAEVEAKKQARREYDQKRRQTLERKELQRRVAQARRDEAKKLGICKDCPNPAVPDRTKCETCAAKHQASRSRRTAKENAAARHRRQSTMF